MFRGAPLLFLVLLPAANAAITLAGRFSICSAPFEVTSFNYSFGSSPATFTIVKHLDSTTVL